MNHPDQIRLFVAVPLPPAVQKVLAQIQKELKQTELCEGRYTNPTQAHLTLVFIGEVGLRDVDQIKIALQAISFPAISAVIGKVDVFEKHGELRIIYLDIICPELASLAHAVEETLSPWVTPEKRPFISHATIMRVKKVRDPEKLLSYIQTISVEPHPFNIDSFLLMESKLGSDGPVYHEIERYHLLRE